MTVIPQEESRVSDSKKISEVEVLQSATPLEKKGKSRRIEPEPPAKLTEEEIRVKYESNDDYQYWTTQVPRLKSKMDLVMRKGLPKLFPDDESMNSILSDHTRASSLRDFLTDELQDFIIQNNIEPSGD